MQPPVLLSACLRARPLRPLSLGAWCLGPQLPSVSRPSALSTVALGVLGLAFPSCGAVSCPASPSGFPCLEHVPWCGFLSWCGHPVSGALGAFTGASVGGVWLLPRAFVFEGSRVQGRSELHQEGPGYGPVPGIAQVSIQRLALPRP